MKQIFLLTVALLLSVSCGNKKSYEAEETLNINGIPMVKLSDNSATYTIKDYSYKRHGGEMKEQTGQDRFKLFSKKATSSEPKYEAYGQKEKITRNVKFKYPISLLQNLAHGTGYDDLAGWVQTKIMLELKIPEAYEGEDETYRSFGFEESVRRWVDSVEDIDDPDFIEEDILVMPWTSNNKIVQFRIDKRTDTGGNSEFPEVKFLIFYRHGVSMLSMYDVFDMWNKDLKALIYRHLNNHLQELGAEPCQPDFRLVIGEEHHIDYSYEPDGIRFWFGNGEVASHLLGIVNFTIPYNELRPYMKEESRRYIDSFSQWHTFEPMTFE